jgi:hypothetical protein
VNICVKSAVQQLDSSSGLLCYVAVAMEPFYKAMKPLFCVSRILGIAPYSLAAEGNLTLSVPAVVYSIILNIVTVLVFLCDRIRAWKYNDDSTTSVTFFGKNILIMATLFTCALCASI